MVITRNMQLTIKKTGRSMANTHCEMLTLKDGERSSVSKSVAELDSVLPYFLGASKAILENVIFCHQDDSLWPLQEPAPLKKKFDEIFEAVKYTKALDNIKDIRKSLTKDLGHLKEKEQWTKSNKIRGDKVGIVIINIALTDLYRRRKNPEPLTKN